MPEDKIPEFTSEQENEFMKQLVGLTVTAASCTDDHLMLEFDHRLRIRMVGFYVWDQRIPS